MLTAVLLQWWSHAWWPSILCKTVPQSYPPYRLYGLSKCITNLKVLPITQRRFHRYYFMILSDLPSFWLFAAPDETVIEAVTGTMNDTAGVGMVHSTSVTTELSSLNLITVIIRHSKYFKHLFFDLTLLSQFLGKRSVVLISKRVCCILATWPVQFHASILCYIILYHVASCHITLYYMTLS